MVQPIPAVAMDMNGLAYIELENGNVSEAERLFRGALKIIRLSFDESHPDVQEVLSGIKLIQQIKRKQK